MLQPDRIDLSLDRLFGQPQRLDGGHESLFH
jgi:hypothetical protein